MSSKWDYLIKNGQVFDGSGGVPTASDIAVSKGKIVEIGHDLDPTQAKETIDATNNWVMPGLVDVHTHYDLEIELTPGLPESVRHGTTTVVMSNCSLGLAFGAQRKDGDDPIVSCFARVENMPKHVLKKVADIVTWDNSADYLDHLKTLKLGPNIVPMVPHSMLRIETMGLKESVSREPSSEELSEMKSLLKTGLEQGYAGFSTDALPFHFLADDPNRDKQIPTQFASYSEIKELTSVVREHDRVWQATPPKDSPAEVLKTFMLSSGRFHGKPLKTTAVAKTLSRLINSKFIKGDFHLQALAAPFKVWSDGPFSPLAEEIDELRELIELDLEDREARLAILNDPDYVKRFKKMWMHGKTGFGLSRLKRKLRLEDYAFNRTLSDMVVDKCPIESWKGQTFQGLLDTLQNKGAEALFEDDTKAYRAFFEDVVDEADFVLATFKAFDTDLAWSTVSANRDPGKTRELLMDPNLLPGFNDSGAHLTNMAFYDGNLRALKLASEGGDNDVSYMVKRLTKDVSELFNIDSGTIAIGATADITIVDPTELKSYNGEDHVQRIYRTEFEHEQLVNRSDKIVPLTMINGQKVWTGDTYVAGLNKKKFGRVLTAVGS